MRRAVLRDVQDLVVEDVDRTPCPRDGLLLRVKTCAVCATDVKIYHYGHQLLRLPRVLGHELAGVVEEVGPQADCDAKPGQRVAVCAVVNCGRCAYCLRGAPSMCDRLEAFGYHYDGGYQEYMAVPAKALRCGGVHPIPDSVSDAEASLAELLACALNGQALSDFRMGQSVLIIGAGPVGLLHAQLARLRGASCVWMADVVSQRRELAERLLADWLTGCLDNTDEGCFLDAIREITHGVGFDQVMLCCGVGSVQRVGLECVAKLGCVNFFGGLPKGRSQVELDTNLIHYKQCRVVGTHGSSALENRQALSLIAERHVEVQGLITNRVGLDDLEHVLRHGASDPARIKSVVALGT